MLRASQNESASFLPLIQLIDAVRQIDHHLFPRNETENGGSTSSRSSCAGCSASEWHICHRILNRQNPRWLQLSENENPYSFFRSFPSALHTVLEKFLWDRKQNATSEARERAQQEGSGREGCLTCARQTASLRKKRQGGVRRD